MIVIRSPRNYINITRNWTIPVSCIYANSILPLIFLVILTKFELLLFVHRDN